MFIDQLTNLTLALQRSAMFPSSTPGPAYVSLLWSEEEFLEVLRSINISLLWSEDLKLLIGLNNATTFNVMRVTFSHFPKCCDKAVET